MNLIIILAIVLMVYILLGLIIFRLRVLHFKKDFDFRGDIFLYKTDCCIVFVWLWDLIKLILHKKSIKFLFYF